MKAAYIDDVGPPENIHFGELPTPAVGPSDVLVKTTAVCVDPVDTLIRSGQLPEDLSFPLHRGAGHGRGRPGNWAVRPALRPGRSGLVQ
jgi:NADPH:quinone reductase-like Zn-dependent oxidoreductase